MNSSWKLMKILGSTKRNSELAKKYSCSIHASSSLQASFVLDGMDLLLSLMFFPMLKDKHTNNTFQVNGHQIKLFHEGPTPTASDLKTISLME
ncbi:hypothetical protein CR513_39213, partial [Mucuna pruriens]